VWFSSRWHETVRCSLATEDCSVVPLFLKINQRGEATLNASHALKWAAQISFAASSNSKQS
jgi:hypothetical protein